jgi:hypothetical protein
LSRSGRGRSSPERGLILFDPNEPCAAAIEPARESSENKNNDGAAAEASGSRGYERENEIINDVHISELCLLETGNPSGTIEPVLEGRGNIDGNDNFSFF